WVVMHLNGQPWFVQPPLYFWIAALCAKVFGVGAFAMRLPAALATIAMGGAVGYATARIAGVRAGSVAAIVLSTSLMQAIVGRLAIMDALLDFAVAAAVLWWYRAFEPSGAPRRRDIALICGALALAFGTLAKGPVAPVITALVIGGWLAWQARAGKLSAPRASAVALALAAYLVVTLPWFVALALRVGPAAIVELIGHYTVGRYTGVIENQRGPVWYYLPVVVLGIFPWIAFLPVALVSGWRSAQRPEGAFERLALVWTVLPLVFFSFASTKLPNYVALMLPAPAILIALWFERVAEARARRAAVVSALTVPLFLGLVAIALAVIMLAGSVGTVVVMTRRAWLGWAPYVLALTSEALVLFIALVAEPAAEQLKPIPPLAHAIDAGRRPGDVVGMHGASGGNALIFYTAPPVADVSDDDDFFATICRGTGIWIVTTPPEAQRLAGLAAARGRDARVVSRRRGDDPRAALLHVFGPPCRPGARG